MAVAISHLSHNPTAPPWVLAPPVETITHPIVMHPDQGRHEPQYETATLVAKNRLGAYEGVDQNGNLVVREAVCEVCGAAFARKFNLQAHMSIHAAEREKASCEWCGRTFYRKGDLKRHAKLHELGHKQFVCEYCGKDFARQDRMRQHIENGKCPGLGGGPLRSAPASQAAAASAVHVHTRVRNGPLPSPPPSVVIKSSNSPYEPRSRETSPYPETSASGLGLATLRNVSMSMPDLRGQAGGAFDCGVKPSRSAPNSPTDPSKAKTSVSQYDEGSNADSLSTLAMAAAVVAPDSEASAGAAGTLNPSAYVYDHRPNTAHMSQRTPYPTGSYLSRPSFMPPNAALLGQAWGPSSMGLAPVPPFPPPYMYGPPPQGWSNAQFTMAYNTASGPYMQPHMQYAPSPPHGAGVFPPHAGTGPVYAYPPGLPPPHDPYMNAGAAPGPMYSYGAASPSRSYQKYPVDQAPPPPRQMMQGEYATDDWRAGSSAPNGREH